MHDIHLSYLSNLYMYVCVDSWRMYVFMYGYMYVFVCVNSWCMYVGMYVCMYVCMYVSMYVCLPINPACWWVCHQSNLLWLITKTRRDWGLAHQPEHVLPSYNQLGCVHNPRLVVYTCRTPALIMEWALLEVRKDNILEARALFARGAAIEPPHPPLLTAWAQFEAGEGHHQEARRIQASADACETSVVYRKLWISVQHTSD